MSSDQATAGLLRILSVGDISGEFVVPAFQRGYRWGEHEVRQLLDDIRASHGTTYYLQPVVVKARPDSSWELVDGQQRLTTLYLIFRCLQQTALPTARAGYSIRYETRPDSAAYLEDLSEAGAASNIDFHHMYNAYRCIEEWFAAFEHRSTHEATRTYGSLFETVKVLWYEAPADTDSTELFTRLNVGRIPLTDAELVKALLLSRAGSLPDHTAGAVEIATHWDAIERDLRNPEMWAFLTGEAAGEATHIGLLLDTLAGGPRGRDRPLFHTFDTLRQRIEADPYGFWRQVVDLHSVVSGWYDDRDLFHKVGYLVAIGTTFGELVELSRDRGRSAFEAALDGRIREHLGLSADELESLTFSSRATGDVLLLMNVETIRRTIDSFERYSFRAHADRRWTLEHIHAQQAEALNRAEQWESWLGYHRTVLADLPGLDGDRRADLLRRIDDTLTRGVTRQTFDALESEITDALSPDADDDGDADGDNDLHGISNLALLDNRDNAALNNSVFEVKRRDIIRRDKEGSYIPVCTRHVFLKYYTDAGSQQLHFWSAHDRAQYLDAIRDALGPYLRTDEAES